MKLIVNADDFGLSPGVNKGIIQAYEQGILRSTTLMVGMAYTTQAAELAKQHKGLDTGIHLRLTAGAPISENVSSMIDSDGLFQNQTLFWSNNVLNSDEVEKEFRAQIHCFLELGLTLSHLDSHHHVHIHQQVQPVMQQLSSEFNVPYRPCQGVHNYGHQRIGFSDQFYGENLSTDAFLTIVRKHRETMDVLELMAHPAIADDELLMVSRYAKQREKELEIITSPHLSEALEKLNVVVTNYSTIRKTY